MNELESSARLLSQLVQASLHNSLTAEPEAPASLEQPALPIGQYL